MLALYLADAQPAARGGHCYHLLDAVCFVDHLHMLRVRANCQEYIGDGLAGGLCPSQRKEGF